jgi:putative hemolysin
MRSIGVILIAALTICLDGAWALANPASVFCVKSGGKSEIRKGPHGEYGICRLPNGQGKSRSHGNIAGHGFGTGVDCAEDERSPRGRAWRPSTNPAFSGGRHNSEGLATVLD